MISLFRLKFLFWCLLNVMSQAPYMSRNKLKLDYDHSAYTSVVSLELSYYSSTILLLSIFWVSLFSH